MGSVAGRLARSVEDLANRQRYVLAIAAAIPLGLAGIGLAHAATLSISAWGLDFGVYWDSFHRWASGGSYYEPWQLNGPYRIHGGQGQFAVLMPPTFILVSAPFTLLPRSVAGLVWVFVPVVVIALAVVRLRPAPWSWPILALMAAWPWTGILIATGNPTLALTATLAVALATGHRWLAVFIALKPTLGPFALVGIRDRSWWLAGLGLAIASVSFGSLWLDWLAAMWNAQDGGLLYSLPHVPIMGLPVVAWLARDRARARFGSLQAEGTGPRLTAAGVDVSA